MVPGLPSWQMEHSLTSPFSHTQVAVRVSSCDELSESLQRTFQCRQRAGSAEPGPPEASLVIYKAAWSPLRVLSFVIITKFREYMGFAQVHSLSVGSVGPEQDSGQASWPWEMNLLAI